MNTSSDYVTVESALKTTIELYGLRPLVEPGFLRPLLERLCPDALHDVASVMTALDAQVPQTLVGAPDDDARLAASGALEKKLRNEHRMNRYAAAWTVRTWLDALGLTMAAAAPLSPALAPTGIATPPAPAPVARPAAASPRVEPPVAVTPKGSTPSPEPVAAPTAKASPPARRPTPYRWLRAGLAVACLVVAAVAFRTPDRPSRVDERRSAATTPPTTTTSARALAAPRIADAAPAPVPAPAPAPTPIETSPPIPTPPPPSPPPPPPPPVAAVVPIVPAPSSRAAPPRDLAPPRPAAALASAGPSPARAAPACRPGTCGTVVVVQQVASATSELTARVEDALGVKVDRPAASAKARYDVVVRFDDRDVRTLRSDRRFRIGERVRAVGNDGRLARIAGG